MHGLKYLLILAIYGLAIFSPAMGSDFAFDDIKQIVKNERLHDINNISYFLTSGINSPLKDHQYFTFYYRPLLFMYYSALYTLSHGNPLPFHIIQLIFFILDSFLVFIFFSKFFSKNLSFLLALTFLVHPVNHTLGSYIADFHDTLYIFFGLLALLVISNKTNTLLKVITSNILLLLSLLSIESGVLFIPVSIFFGKLISNYKTRIYFPFLLLIMSIYLWMRYLSFQNHFLTYLTSFPIQQPLINRILFIPTLVFYFFKEICMPTLSMPNEIVHNPPNQLIILGAHTILILAAALYALYLKKHNPKFLTKFIFFIFWLLLGLILYIQIIPLDMLFARRWLTFTLIGVLGTLGVIVTTIPVKSKKLILTVKILYIIYIIALTIATIKLNLSYLEWELHIASSP